jgi:hypothetical protein
MLKNGMIQYSQNELYRLNFISQIYFSHNCTPSPVWEITHLEYIAQNGRITDV